MIVIQGCRPNGEAMKCTSLAVLVLVRRTLGIALLLLSFVPSISTASPWPWEHQAAPGCEARPNAGWLVLSGESKGEAFELGVTAAPLLGNAAQGQIEIWLEPSHARLLTFPLAEPADSSQKSTPVAAVVRFPFGFGEEAEFRAVAVFGGERFTLTAAKVRGEVFEVSTAFELVSRKDGRIEVGSFQHCCSGPRCSRMCVTCKGPGFSCDLIECSIECDSNFGGI